MSFELRCNGFSSQRFLCIGQSAYTDETMFFLPTRHSLSTIPIELVNVVARKVYTREELFVIRAQNYRWSNNSLYYRLKSLGIFKYRGGRSGFSSKLCLQTNNQAIPAICSRRCRDDLCASYNFRQTFGSARLARKPSYNLITIESQATVPKKNLLLNQLRPRSMSPRFSFRMSCHWHRKLTK